MTKSDWVSRALENVVEERRLADLATVISEDPRGLVPVGAKLVVDSDGSTWGSLGDQELDRLVEEDGRMAIGDRKSRVSSYSLGAESGNRNIEVFHEVLEPQPQLLIIGAGHIAVPLAHFGKTIGFDVVVIDDRDKYANVERFPDADQVIAAEFGETLQGFPMTPATYVVIITRAHTYDEESLRIILEKPWAYL